MIMWNDNISFRYFTAQKVFCQMLFEERCFANKVKLFNLNKHDHAE